MPAGAPAGTGIYALPKPGWARDSAEGPLNNYFTLAISGAKNDQYTIRGDQNLSPKDTMFERYTWWKSFNLPTVPYGNGLVTGDPISPEAFVDPADRGRRHLRVQSHLASPTCTFRS